MATSFELAIYGGIVVALGGIVVALFAESFSRRKSLLIEAGALLAFAFPAIVVGVAINVFWGKIGTLEFLPQFLSEFVDEKIYGGMGIFFLCYLMLYLPFAVRSVRASLSRMEPRQLEALALTKRSSWAGFRAVIFPVALPGFAAAFLLGFVLSMGELGASLVVQPPDYSTVQIRIFNMIHFARDEEVAALCVMVVVVTLLPMLTYVTLFNRKVEVL